MGIVAVVVALIGGFVQSRRHKERLAFDIHMGWRMFGVVGIASIVGAAYHIFDDPDGRFYSWMGRI